MGPNSAVGAGSLLLLIESQVDYAVAATLKLQRERLKSIEVKAEAVDDYDEYIDVSENDALRYFLLTFCFACRAISHWYVSLDACGIHLIFFLY